MASSAVQGLSQVSGSSTVNRYRIVFSSTRVNRSTKCSFSPDPSERITRGKVSDVNHQRITLPMTARVSSPLADALRCVRTSIRGNNANRVVHFVENGHVSRSLYNLHIVVIGGRQHRHSFLRQNQTAGAQPPILRAIHFMSTILGSEIGGSLAGLW